MTFTCSLIGILLRDYTKGHGSHFIFLFPSVIREEMLCVSHHVVASYFKLRRIKKKKDSDGYVPGQVSLALSSYEVMSPISVLDVGMHIGLKTRKRRAALGPLGS